MHIEPFQNSTYLCLARSIPAGSFEHTRFSHIYQTLISKFLKDMIHMSEYNLSATGTLFCAFEILGSTSSVHSRVLTSRQVTKPLP